MLSEKPMFLGSQQSAVICILNMGMLLEKPMFLGSQQSAAHAKNALRPALPPWQPTSTIPLVPPLALAAALQAASGLGHDSAGRGGSMPAHPRPASSSSAGLVLEQDTRSSPMKGPLGVVLWHLPSLVWHSEPSMAHSLISSSEASEALVSFSSALEFFSAVFLEAFSWAAARSALAFFWPASCMSFSNAASALAATLANFSA